MSVIYPLNNVPVCWGVQLHHQLPAWILSLTILPSITRPGENVFPLNEMIVSDLFLIEPPSVCEEPYGQSSHRLFLTCMKG